MVGGFPQKRNLLECIQFTGIINHTMKKKLNHLSTLKVAFTELVSEIVTVIQAGLMFV